MMNSPISGLLAEFKLRWLEEVILNFNNFPLIWLRYIDDMFIIWQSDAQQLNTLVNKLNFLDDNIKFTLELESAYGTSLFLDVLIRKMNDGSITWTTYRKPIANFSIIPYSAPVPVDYELANFKYCTFPCISRSIYKLRVLFFFENLSKIENSYISQVGKNRNLAKYEKNEILPSRKNFFASKHITKRAKMFPIYLLFQWCHSEHQMNHHCANTISSRANLVSFPRHAKELNFSPKWRLLIWEGKISQPF